jgi:outer membrane protein TolC
MSLADFEDSVREFVSNVENAYWDLFYAYRELEAQTAARDAAASVAQKTRVKEDEGQIGKLELASANEQLLRFESAIIESMEGRLIDGTQANSGISGGSFRRNVGVRTAERRLRYLIGMSITDGTLLKPADQPVMAALAFDWNQSVDTALSNRPEVRRQKWMIKQKELELTAARNFLLPRVDLVGNYRLRGLGKHLAGSGSTFNDDIASNATSQGARSDAITDLLSGEFQEVRFGAEVALPVGFRQANSAVRNAELSVQRERAVLKEQERKIVLDLSNTIAECRRAYNAMQVAQQRHQAATEYRSQALERLDRNRVQYDVLLEAQRRILEAQLQFINAEVEYAVAIKNVHFERSSFLQYHGIALVESQSDPKAASDYRSRKSRMTQPLNYAMQDPPIGIAKGLAMPQSACSQCGASHSDCNCNPRVASSGCAQCGQTTCTCQPGTVPAMPATTSVAKQEAPKESESEESDLPANGLGKNKPKFLPPPSQ